MLRMLILFSVLVFGCAEGTSTATPPLPDMGNPDMPDTNNDAGTDAGNNVPDMPPVPAMQTTLMPGASGGQVETSKHQLRIVVGAPTPAGDLRTPNHTIQLGVGPAQHGQ